MAYNFLRGDRDQPFLLPPDLRDWLPQDHLAWFVRDVTDQLDLAPFLRGYRADGHGHPAYDPKTLLGVLLYGYCVGVRSSRQVERRCHEDIAFRVLAGNQAPDHVTIARFRVRHQTALAGFLVESLKLCAAAGMVKVGTVALDGTKLAANAANAANTASHTHEKIEREVAEILRQAAEADQREDQLFGDARGDELPEALASKAGRLARLRQAKAQLEAEAAERQRRYGQRVATLAAAARAKGKQPRAHIKPRRRDEAPNPKATANTTDPDSRFMHTRRGSVQGYNAQAVTTCGQVIVAAELTQQANDLQQLDPMLAATAATLAAAGIPQRPGRLLADSGYWTIANLTQLPDAPELLIPPARHGRQGKPRKDGKPSASKSDGLRATMTAKLASDDGKALYALRQQTVEPVFGQVKEQQGARRLLRRGLAACDAEWKLLCGTHNLLKLWRHTAAQPVVARRPPEPRSRRGPSHRGGRRPPGGSGHRDAPRPEKPLTTCTRRLWATGSQASRLPTVQAPRRIAPRTCRAPVWEASVPVLGPSRWRFPDPATAGEDGLVGVGADLEPATLLDAYRRGIFPWPHPGAPLPWFSPDPRGVIPPDGVVVARSLRARLRRCGWETTVDRAFAAVIDACAQRPGAGGAPGEGTWITPPMRTAYRRLHELGHAHSLEVWDRDELVGGLYGIGVGGVFTGESMFHLATDASKVALVDLAARLAEAGGRLIDVQVVTPHLATLGARDLPRAEFLDLLARVRDAPVRLAAERRPVARLCG